MYKLYKDPITNTVNVVMKIDGNERKYIPFDEDNLDYQEYLEWKAEGNTAEEAD